MGGLQPGPQRAEEEGVGHDPPRLESGAPPRLARKPTSRPPLSEAQLLGYIESFCDTHDEVHRASVLDIKEVVEDRAQACDPAEGWWNFRYADQDALLLPELMERMHCEGLANWAHLSASALVEPYTYFIRSGLGTVAMLNEGSDRSWLRSLHRDTFCECSALGLRRVECDSLLIGLIGRKRVVLLPPSAALPLAPCLGQPDLWCCSAEGLIEAGRLPRAAGWVVLERAAADAGGVGFTVDPETYCTIPAKWWHIVRPLDYLTAVAAPSFVQGSWGDRCG